MASLRNDSSADVGDRSDPRSSQGSELVAWSVAFTLTLAVIAAGLASDTPLSVVAGAAAFLFFAVGNDVHRYRVPNLLTLPALGAALLVSPWYGATSGPLEAALGAALGFALLLGPY